MTNTPSQYLDDAMERLGSLTNEEFEKLATDAGLITEVKEKTTEITIDADSSSRLLQDVEVCMRGAIFFNRATGKLQGKTSVEDLRKQAERVLEEAKEGVEATTEKELLDSVVDVLVTAAGYLAQAAERGYDLNKAIHRIRLNNEAKLFYDKGEALQHAFWYKTKGEDVYLQEVVVKGTTLPPIYSIKRTSDDKVMKPRNHLAVDLSDCLPEGVK